MKKLLGFALASALVLSACGNDEKEKKEEPKKESKTKDKTEKKKVNTEKQTVQKINDNQNATENQATSEITNEQTLSNAQSNEPNVSNVTDNQTLNQILNGNYTEEQKIQAYNSAVANGVIPQGVVTEGSAQAAYESSLAIQNGISEKEQMAQRYQSWVDAGLMTEEEMQTELSKF
ncbi:hypothetical protein [Staphylococcus americanisciuri]|uniref:Lipoprotein n=1 Tax=Staphylococcus americanisciuri TaxID=2973940 RepID=A0ABT2F247_9STAP|nr:hypothetical protein [Staphylococcus americanisciuri]MCS4486341.1 hypothetical protein [Staphylococcus americanisciuri]